MRGRTSLAMLAAVASIAWAAPAIPGTWAPPAQNGAKPPSRSKAGSHKQQQRRKGRK